jgi:hypothetical protein
MVAIAMLPYFPSNFIVSSSNLYNPFCAHRRFGDHVVELDLMVVEHLILIHVANHGHMATRWPNIVCPCRLQLQFSSFPTITFTYLYTKFLSPWPVMNWKRRITRYSCCRHLQTTDSYFFFYYLFWVSSWSAEPLHITNRLNQQYISVSDCQKTPWSSFTR